MGGESRTRKHFSGRGSQQCRRRIRAYQHDTEPVEWPPITGSPERIVPDPLRTSFMRVGSVSLVPKRSISTPAVQAADLLAYLIGCVSRQAFIAYLRACLTTYYAINLLF